MSHIGLFLHWLHSSLVGWEHFSFICFSNDWSKSEVADINDAISLIATDDFTEQLLTTIKLYYPDIVFDNNEYFALNNGSLIILKSPNYEKLKASDIQDFAPIVNRELTHSYVRFHNQIQKVLLGLFRNHCIQSSPEPFLLLQNACLHSRDNWE